MKVNLREAHPAMYWTFVVLSVWRISLAFNFWFARPTFTPYGIHRSWAGVAFIALGVIEVVLLHTHPRKARTALSLSCAVILLWGLVNTQQWVRGQSSGQLPLTFAAIAAVQYIQLTFPASAPLPVEDERGTV